MSDSESGDIECDDGHGKRKIVGRYNGKKEWFVCT